MQGLLDCPHYTRPESFLFNENESDEVEKNVPDVLLSGDHQVIEEWRLQQALGRTWLRRPDLLEKLELTDKQQSLLAEFKKSIK